MTKRKQDIKKDSVKRRRVDGGDDKSSRCKKKSITQQKQSSQNILPTLHQKSRLNNIKTDVKINSFKNDAVATNRNNNDDSNKWSKSKKKRMRLLKAKTQLQEEPNQTESDFENATDKNSSNKKVNDEIAAVSSSLSTGNNNNNSSSSFLINAFKARLAGSRFRELNEELYTTTSSEAYTKFKSQPDLYQQYHDGFRIQVSSWPVNPVTVIVDRIKNKYNHGNLPVVVADFGCGDAELARQLQRVVYTDNSNNNNSDKQQKQQQRFKVHSFDLVASNDNSDDSNKITITACDMAHTPLKNNSVDVGVFCLSLMGTNLADFVREAYRVLKSNKDNKNAVGGGCLYIAEVRSRFESKNNADALEEFIKVLSKLGFDCVDKDQTNTMFVLLELRKSNKKPLKDVEYTAKPCYYKRR